jgi:hypothetical protein
MRAQTHISLIGHKGCMYLFGRPLYNRQKQMYVYFIGESLSAEKSLQLYINPFTQQNEHFHCNYQFLEQFQAISLYESPLVQ